MQGPEFSASRLVVSSVVHLRPEEMVLDAMFNGWSAQMLSRGLAPGTVEARAGIVRRFQEFTGEYPWQWGPSDVEDWTTELRSSRSLALSTLRVYQAGLRQFCDYLVDGRYGWAQECMDRFGSHPVQVCHEWNTISHSSEAEARPGVRPLSRAEVQALFDYSDDQVAGAHRSGRKGWQAAWRDAALFKVMYAFGLRRREAALLETVDFQSNPKEASFGCFGVCNVRWAKARKGGVPRRRSVLAVMPWSSGVLEEYVEEIRPLYGPGAGLALWPTERGQRVSPDHVTHRFAEYRDAIGLPKDLHPHCLRHSYVTHLIEDGFDPFFVQQQVGHAWGSTTALYTGVSDDFKNRSLRSALDRLSGRGKAGR